MCRIGEISKDPETSQSHKIRSAMRNLSPIRLLCHGSDNGNYGDPSLLHMIPCECRDMVLCEADTCLSYEEVMSSRQAEIRDNASSVSALSRVDSSVSMAACSLHDWEFLDDPTVDYCHLFASPGRRQAKEFNSALLVLSSFPLPPLFVFLRTLCLHLMEKERTLRLLHGTSRRRLETRFFMHVRDALMQMHCNNWT
jgi:hypothetical protein